MNNRLAVLEQLVERLDASQRATVQAPNEAPVAAPAQKAATAPTPSDGALAEVDRLHAAQDLDAVEQLLSAQDATCAEVLWRRARLLEARAQEAKVREGVAKCRHSATARAHLLDAMDHATKALAAQEDSLVKLSKLEELIASKYEVPKPPSEFAGLPYLNGRAEVEFVLKRPGAKFDVEGKLYDELNIRTVVDGYTSPITAGNFVDLVQKGFYDGMHVQRSDGFVVQTGDPSKEKEGIPNGFVPEGEKNVRKIPLEVSVIGDKGPIYGSTFDDDGRGGYAAKLPFNAYGALGMAREEYDADSASSQWFWLLFDSDLTPAGKNLLDGRYACFGYTIDGARLLSDVKEGDLITSAKVVKGLDLLSKV